ncbi:hypothetical protein AVEN_228331-1 [Araneus ventricosus]|uniref:Uncharacterized protein n=1 Tax=Araneus ventricosus TaxID=182803 RepID=A0A4Y2K840_ARAVE|nr:hypothetical protein AVEN_228331-1 [Araneus ventricosus]
MPSGLNNSQYRMACNVSNKCNAFPKFFMISSAKSTLKFVSPIVIYKTITGLIGGLTYQKAKQRTLSYRKARKIVNDRTPKPGLSYSSALNSTITPSEPNTPQNSQRAPKVINSTLAAPTIVDPLADKGTITVKKSDWLALLAIKRSWEETSSPATKKPKRRRDL